jgi:hypothetical protein
MLSVLTVAFALSAAGAAQEVVTFDDNWGAPGIQVTSQSPQGLEIVYSVPSIQIHDLQVDNQNWKKISLPGALLGNNEGAPDLPGIGRYLAFPQGANVIVEVTESRTYRIEGIDLSPAPVIPRENDDSPLKFEKNPAIFGQDAVYPVQPVMQSEPRKMRGVDVFILGITPFAYNPVQKDLTVYTDLRIQVTFQGGNGVFGDTAYRSRWWEPILKQNILNFDMLPSVNFNKPQQTRAADECEYMIFVPNKSEFLERAETIKDFRVKQGISTGIFNIADLGGTANGIENKINTAYNDWGTKPVAILLLGDLPDMPVHIWNGYCESDTIYADIDGDDLPELNAARMTGRNAAELDIIINKFLSYETNPPTNPNFYANPVIAGGWQTERWFILCTEICLGYLQNVQGKTPVREYAIYSGSPGSVWSTNQNTYMLLDYFGPDGLGYIPATPSHLTDWGGNATRINNDINSGAFYMLHRDHGYELGWGEPDYDINDLNGLNNDDLIFVLSINCCTGDYGYSPECFTEAFHRVSKRALGVIAASAISYSFVNDTFIFGLHDSMWPDFDPGYGGSTGPNVLMPGFAQSAGKHYLEASNWPYNPSNKDETYHLFHMHGDAFTQIYTEMPQTLTVSHDTTIESTATYFYVTADADSLIALSAHDKVLGTATGTGGPTMVMITPPENPGTMYVTVTKPNHYRYEGTADILIGGPLAMWLPDDPPDSRLPGPSDTMTAKILNGDENYVPGSGLLHYRFDSADPYSTTPLTDIGGNLHEGVLPGCGPTGAPEFYFSAQGDLGSTVYVPPDAPTNFFSMGMDPLLEILMFDDMEANVGWTVFSQNLQTGEWEHGDPVGTSAQSEHDHTPDGTKCFVTGRTGGSSGDNDVDGGPTILTSPVYDMSGGDAEMHIWTWHHHTDYGTQQPMTIEITNGGTWVKVKDIQHSPNWTEHSFLVSDYVTPNSSVQVRFTAIDNPNDDIVEGLVDDIMLMRLNYNAPLWSSAYSVSVAAGAVVDLSMDAGIPNGNKPYLLLGTLSGNMPGYSLPGGLNLPINWDSLTDLIMIALNTPAFVNFYSTFDGAGTATATLNTLGALDPVLIGETAHFAYAVGGWQFVSNAVPVEFEP